MGRSVKKGPFVDEHLMKKVEELNKNHNVTVIVAEGKNKIKETINKAKEKYN